MNSYGKTGSASLYDLGRYFEAHIEKSNRKFHRIKRVESQWYVDPKSTAAIDHDSYQMRMEYVEGIAIHIPEHRVDDFLSVLEERRFKEVEIRNNVPAVKKAYEQYQLLLKMCGFEDNARY